MPKISRVERAMVPTGCILATALVLWVLWAITPTIEGALQR